jgi:predicted nuclease with TOPRIM domain
MRDDIGSDSAAEKDAEIEELRNAKHRLEIENSGLRREIEKLRNDNAGLRDSLEEASRKFINLSGEFDELRHRVGQPAPADDGIPEFLRRARVPTSDEADADRRPLQS